MQRFYLLPVMFLITTLFVLPANAQATRTWVSGVGDDANPCSRTAPCKTFAGAISKTAASGEINCIDPGGFGAVTLTKSITIDCSSTLAGVLVSGTNGINVNGAGVVVTLRGLDINGLNTSPVGVNFINGAALHIEKCNIYGFNSGTGAAISFAPPAGVTASLYVSDSSLLQNFVGVLIQPSGSGAALAMLERVLSQDNTIGFKADGTGNTSGMNLTIKDSVAARNSFGVVANTPAGGPGINMLVDHTAIVNSSNTGVTVSGTGAVIRLNFDVIVNNATGLTASNSGTLNSYNNNAIDANGAGSTATIISLH